MSKCQDDSYLEDTPIEEAQKKSKPKKDNLKKKIKYKGFTVNHRFNSTEDELKEKHTKKYLKKLYNKLRKIKKGKSKVAASKVVEEDLELPSSEVIAEAAKVVLNQFPYEKIEGYNSVVFDDENFLNTDMIIDDFDNFTESDIEPNNEILDDYYSQNLDYLVLEEIAQNPQIYDNTVMSKTNNELLIAACTILAMEPNGYGWVRGSIAYALAGSGAKAASKDFYPLLDGADTRRDAYRHILWNSLLAQYYFTISSKAPRIGFAKLVTDAREEGLCANSNAIDSREMDYHNNFIGRKIWDDNTDYITFLGWNIGLSKPRTSHLKNLVHAKVEKESCFIITKYPDGSLGYTPAEAKNKILSVYDNIAVYLLGDIAPRQYITQTTYDYSACGGGGVMETSTNTSKDKTLMQGAKVAIADDDDCVQLVYTLTTLNACFHSKDPNYDPYY
jgi:hypothetical protein